MKLPFAFLILALGVPGAVSHAADGSVGFGGSIHAGGPRVRPVKLIEDSRCPANARCVQAGRVVLRAAVTGGHWSRTIDLTLGKPVPVADDLLTLVSVTPERTAGCSVSQFVSLRLQIPGRALIQAGALSAAFPTYADLRWAAFC